MNLTDWIGRQVRRTDNDEGDALGPAVVLAVDDDPDGAAAWIKYPAGVNGRSAPHYRSVDLRDLEIIPGSNGDPSGLTREAGLPDPRHFPQ